MGFRFQKRIRILPGYRLNISKTGVSTSFGGKGLTVNLRDGKTKTTVGIPGAGLSYSETSSANSSGAGPAIVLIVIAVVILLSLVL